MDFAENDTCLWVFEALVPSYVNRPGDFLALMVKRAATGQIEGEYRFRWHAGPGFDAKDEKSFWRLGPIDDTPEARAKLLAAFRRILTELETPWECEVNGDIFKMHALMKTGPLEMKVEALLGGKDPLGGRA